MSCGVLPPRRRPFERDAHQDLTGCPLPIGHHGPHRTTVAFRDLEPLAKRVTYEWDSEDDCGCCDIRDVDRCFWYGEL